MYPVMQFLYMVGCSLALVLCSTSMPDTPDGLLVRSKAYSVLGIGKSLGGMRGWDGGALFDCCVIVSCDMWWGVLGCGSWVLEGG